MSTSGGPKIISDNLVLCLDAHDAKSYAGEPTTNLSANSDYSGATLDSINSSSNGGWGSSFDRWVSLIEGPAGKKVRAFHLKLTGTTGSAHAEGAPYELSGIDSQYGSLTSGNSYRASAWAKVIRANGSSTAQTSSNLLYLTGTASLGSSNMTVGTEWTKISASFSISSTGNYRLRHYFYNVSVGDILVIAEPQIELKGYATPYVYSSRSATNGWVDRTGNSNGTLVSAMTGTETAHRRVGQVIMPASSSYLNFDGDDDQLTCTTSAFDLKCFEIAIQQYQTVTPDGSMGLDHSNVGFTVNSGSGTDPHKNGLNIGSWTGSMTNETVSWWGYGTGGNYATYIRDTILAGWHIYTINWNGSSYDIWIDGNKKTTYLMTAHAGLFEDVTKVSFGKNEGWNYFFQGKIGLARCYKASLTDSQIKQNFKAHRGRFGI